MGQPQRGEALAKDLQARRLALSNKGRSPLVAAYITPGGVTAGSGTTVGTMIDLAGFEGIGKHYEIAGWGALPLERFIVDPPDILIASFFDLPSAKVSHWSLARHARVNKMLEEIPTIYVPGRYLSCGGLFSVDAAEFIRSEALRLDLIGPGGSAS
jgi:iron complex transport system substrate-binding protein